MSQAVNSYSPRVAIVTGAAQGIGLSVALRFAEDGIDVAVNDIVSKTDKINEVVAELKKKGRRAIAIPGDVSSESEVQAMIAKTVQELGCLDIMVANAGIAPATAFLDITTEQIDTVNAINIRGTFLCYKYAALQMIKQGRGGRIIGASSTAGKQGTPRMGAYSASKFAIRGITQTASIEFRKHRITVNAYAPGFIVTPLTLGLIAEASSGTESYGVATETPSADPDVIASAVSYLVKPEAHFITGQSINICGGLRFE